MASSDGRKSFYDDYADWWLLLSPVEEYADEAASYIELLQRYGPVKRVLELGSGGGNVAWYMKRHFDLTLVDLAPAMLAESAKLNPECRHIAGDMRDVKVDGIFDAVFVHDAIGFMTSLADLEAMMRNAFAHLKPGGAALFCPDFVEDDFVPYTDCGGADGEDGRALRYLEWVDDPVPGDGKVRWVFDFVMRHADGRIETLLDDGEGGLFSEAQWLATLREVGFEAEIHRNAAPENTPGEGPPGQVQLVARKP